MPPPSLLQPANYKRYPRPDSLAPLVPGLPAEGVDLMTRMLQHDPAKRVTAREAMEHPFFQDLPEVLRAGGLYGSSAVGVVGGATSRGGSMAPQAQQQHYAQPMRYTGK